MRAPDIAGIALLAPLVYAAAVALPALGPVDLAVFLGVLAAVGPAAGLVSEELGRIAWLPGLFLFVVLFTVSGITPNALPGPLGDLIGGWVAASGLFAGLIALGARDARGTRAFTSVVALLAAVATVATASAGPWSSPAAFANAFAALPRSQADALGVVLTGSVPSALPFDAGLSGLFLLLLLLGGAGALSGLFSVDTGRPVELLGFERSDPEVPEGTFRSLFPEGRERLKEATPSAEPTAAELPALGSLLTAVLAGTAALVAAVYWPDDLLPFVTGATVALVIAVAVASWRSRPEGFGRGPAPPPSAAPTPAGAPTRP